MHGRNQQTIDDLQKRVAALEAREAELLAQLDRERLFPGQWANRRIRDEFGRRTRKGPFTGLEYPDWAMTSVDLFAQKILGCFELELHAAIEAAIEVGPEQVVNIGTADGYYVVGLALRLPDAQVLGIEPEEWRVAQLRPIAEHNGVAERVEILLEPCTAALLDEHLRDEALVICDCDGPEADILDPAMVPRLRTARLIVETHDLIVPGTAARLRAALTPTHDIEMIESRERFVDDFPETNFMPLVTRQLAISEFRGARQTWLVAVPK